MLQNRPFDGISPILVCMLQGQVLSNIMSAMLIGESGRDLFIINDHCLCFIHLWRAGRTQRHELGTLSINDIQMLLPKFDPNPSDGGTIT